MKRKLMSITMLLVLVLYAGSVKSEMLCSVFVLAHGLEKISSEDLGRLNAFRWDYNDEIIKASKNLASPLYKKIVECKDKPVVIKAHGYGMSVLYNILGMGKRYSEMFPEHEYVKIYKATTAVYSIAGTFSGTPLMDRICTNISSKSIEDVLGNKCIYSMTTASVHHPSHFVNSPGVPVYLLSSTYRGDDTLDRVKILSGHNLSWEEYFTHEGRNQNDGVIPLYSALACEYSEPLIYKDSNCEKINSLFFRDYKRSDYTGHYKLIHEITDSNGDNNEK